MPQRRPTRSLKEYKLNRHLVAHQTCSECGDEHFARGQKPDGTKVIAVNVATIDGIDLPAIKMTPFDGKKLRVWSFRGGAQRRARNPYALSVR